MGGRGDFARHGFLPSLSTTEQLWRARYSVIIKIICNINIDKKVPNDLMMNDMCGVVEYFVGLSDDVKGKKDDHHHKWSHFSRMKFAVSYIICLHIFSSFTTSHHREPPTIKFTNIFNFAQMSV